MPWGDVKPSLKVVIALAIASVASILLAIYGWLIITPHVEWSDAIFRGLKSFEMSGSYDKLRQEFGNTHGVGYLEAARYLGVLVEFSAVGLLVYTLLEHRWTGLRASLRHGHVIVVGDSRFADNVCENLGCEDLAREVVHVRGANEEIHCRGKLIRLPLKGSGLHGLNDAGAHRAARIVFANADEDAALDLALAAAQSFPKAQIDIRLSDTWLARRIHQIPGAEHLRAFSEPDAAAREIVRRHPPYLLAQDQAHARIHAVLIGDMDWLEALMGEIILSACTLTFGAPVFSFVCDAPDAFAARLRLRYPEIDKAADLAFYAAGPLVHSPAVDLTAIMARAPVTAVYVALKERGAALSAATTFSEQGRKAAAFTAPVFTLTGSVRELPRPRPASALKPLTLVPFGQMDDIARAAGLLSHEGDVAEQRYHAAYLDFAPGTGDAAKLWPELKEEYRVSNRRAVAHIYAKLFEAGFDLRPWMESHDIWAELPVLATGQPLWRDADEYRRLAVLEHERWIADRRLSGWAYGKTRDNERKLHPDIKPFDELTPEVQGYDMKFIELLAQVLKTAPEGMTRIR